MIILMALALATTPSVCTKLAKDFEENERTMAGIHLINKQVADASHTFLVASYSGKADLAWHQDLETMRKEDVEFLEKGDRITTLLLANHCTAPDHVTSYTTFASKP
jgi:hypothetical protein